MIEAPRCAAIGPVQPGFAPGGSTDTAPGGR